MQELGLVPLKAAPLLHDVQLEDPPALQVSQVELHAIQQLLLN